MRHPHNYNFSLQAELNQHASYSDSGFTGFCTGFCILQEPRRSGPRNESRINLLHFLRIRIILNLALIMLFIRLEMCVFIMPFGRKPVQPGWFERNGRDWRVIDL